MNGDQQILETATEAFTATTGLRTTIAPPRRNQKGHAVLQIENHKKKYKFLIEVKAVDRLATPALVKAKETQGCRLMLVAPYIAPDTAEHCRRLGVAFMDTAGNTYVEGEGLFVWVVGQRRPPDFQRNKFRALTPAGMQVTFALLCRPDLVRENYRTIARAAKVALGTIGPVLADLRARGLLKIGANADLRIVDYRGLRDEWVMHYPTVLRPKLEKRRFEADPDTLAHAKLKLHHAFWGGETAADRLTHLLRPKEFTIYTADDWTSLAAAYLMRKSPRGNVEVLKAFWDFGMDNFDPDLVPPLLVYADLMASHDGRNIETANLIRERHLEPKLP